MQITPAFNNADNPIYPRGVSPTTDGDNHKLMDTAMQLDTQAGVHPERNAELREAFNNFVGQTLFGQLMKSMRTSVGKPAYFHGGQTEEIFQSQLDAVMTEELTEASAKSYADPMFELFMLSRQ